MPRHPDWTAADATAMGVLDAQGGVAHLDAFRAAGLTEYQVAAVFRRGVMNRPRKGWYTDPSLPWQANRAVRVGGHTTCVTAAALWGLPVPPGSHARLHIGVDAHDTRLRHNRDKNRVVHAGDDLEVVTHRRTLHDPAVWRTSLVDTLLQLAWCVPLEWLVTAIDAALHRPLDGSREPLLPESEYQRFEGLLPSRFHEALDLADPSAESPLETLLRIGMVRRGIPQIVPQFRPHGRYRADFLVLGRLLVEADGEEFHDAEQDAIRDAFLRALGYRILRFGYEAIVFHLDDVIAAIVAELLSMGVFVDPGN